MNSIVTRSDSNDFNKKLEEGSFSTTHEFWGKLEAVDSFDKDLLINYIRNSDSPKRILSHIMEAEGLEPKYSSFLLSEFEEECIDIIQNRPLTHVMDVPLYLKFVICGDTRNMLPLVLNNIFHAYQNEEQFFNIVNSFSEQFYAEVGKDYQVLLLSRIYHLYTIPKVNVTDEFFDIPLMKNTGISLYVFLSDPKYWKSDKHFCSMIKQLDMGEDAVINPLFSLIDSGIDPESCRYQVASTLLEEHTRMANPFLPIQYAISRGKFNFVPSIFCEGEGGDAFSLYDGLIHCTDDDVSEETFFLVLSFIFFEYSNPERMMNYIDRFTYMLKTKKWCTPKMIKALVNRIIDA